MKAGKVPEAAVKRAILNAVGQQEPSGQPKRVSGAGVGKDAGLFDMPLASASQMEGVQTAGGPLAMACAVHCGMEPQAASLALFRACNSLAATGAEPAFVTAQLTLPEAAEEAEIKAQMGQLLTACHAAGVLLAQGHTEVSAHVWAPVIGVTALGAAACPKKEGTPGQQEGIRQQQEARQPKHHRGSVLVMTKYAGISGTALLASQFYETLHTRYPSFLLEKAKALYGMVSVQREAKLAWELGVTAMHDVAEGGVFGAAWELAERENIGLALDLRKIPIRQETVELCEFFDVNPYQLKGDGALLFLTDESERVISALLAAGIPAAAIGMVEEGNGRILKNEEEIRFLEPNRVDCYEAAVAAGKRFANRKDVTG